MSAFKINFRIQIADVADKSEVDGLDMSCTAELPFIPRVGDKISACAGDDFREVENIYWSAKDGFEVFFVFEAVSGVQIVLMKKRGWKEDE